MGPRLDHGFRPVGAEVAHDAHVNLNRSGSTVSNAPPLVSIITPTYNHERYIQQCLESVVAQTETRWEQIVVDDGSDDGTAAIIQAVADPRVRYVRHEHRGIAHLAQAYNLALGLARGSFIAVLEGDDFWPPDKLDRQLPLFDRPEVVLSWGSVMVTDEFGAGLRTRPTPRVLRQMAQQSAGSSLKALLGTNFIPAVTVMCRRDALLRVGGFKQPDGVPTTDYPTWLELSRIGPFAVSREVLGYYRRHRAQVSARMRVEMNDALDWGTRFVERLSDQERRALGVTIEEALRIERHRHARLDYEAGRAALRAGRHVAARAYFRRALRDGSRTTRAKGAVGLSCSFLGLDLERLVTIINRTIGR